jgi:hypothetical protein
MFTASASMFRTMRWHDDADQPAGIVISVLHTSPAILTAMPGLREREKARSATLIIHSGNGPL